MSWAQDWPCMICREHTNGSITMSTKLVTIKTDESKTQILCCVNCAPNIKNVSAIVDIPKNH